MSSLRWLTVAVVIALGVWLVSLMTRRWENAAAGDTPKAH